MHAILKVEEQCLRTWSLREVPYYNANILKVGMWAGGGGEQEK